MADSPPSPAPHTPALPGAPASRIRVLIVDDSRDITDILGRCIAREPDMESAGALHTANDLAAEVVRTRADIVLLDLTMPGKDPLAAMREVAGGSVSAPGADGPTVRIIAFSGRGDPDAVNSAMKAGARGFLSKDASVPVMLDAIRKTARGPAPFAVWR